MRYKTEGRGKDSYKKEFETMPVYVPKSIHFELKKIARSSGLTLKAVVGNIFNNYLYKGK